MPPKRVIDNDEFEQRKKERQASIMHKVQDLTPDETAAYLDRVYKRWKLDEDAESSCYSDTIDLAFSNFGMDLSTNIHTGDMGSFGLRGLDEKIHDSEMEMIGLYNKLREHKLLENPQTMRRTMACLEQIYYAKRLVLNAFQGRLSAHHMQTTLLPDGSNPYELDKDLDARLGSWCLRFRWIDDDTVPYQKLLLYMLERAMERRYRRQGDQCFEPIIVNGHDTHAWRAVMTVREWLYKETMKETNWEQWLWLTSNNSTPKAVESYLLNCCDYSFPELTKDRSTFSFLNGVYRASEHKFYPHEDNTLPNTIASCKFFNLEFPERYMDISPDEIPTPHLDSIMEYQEWSKEVQRWMYIFLGRLLYNLNEKDSWQVIPFCMGVASCGKSTITLKVAKQFYDDIDVGCLSNNIEAKFGLSQFQDKLLFVAPEIKSDLRIEQAEFQSIVSGEDITINQKYRTAFSKQWTVPGILAGNEVPTWCDNSGSIQRRIVLFDFSKQVVHGDMRLGDKLQAELPAILLKSNAMYLEAVSKYGNDNIWTILPAYFQSTRSDMAQSTNVLDAFIHCEEVVIDPDSFCAFDDFKASLKVFASQNNYPTKRMNWEFFRNVFDKHHVTKRREMKVYHGRRVSKEFLFGITLSTLGSPNKPPSAQ